MLEISNLFIKFDQNRSVNASVRKIETANGKGKVSNPVMDYNRRQSFTAPEYNFAEIGVIEDVESYVRQAFQKKVALMFKEGEKLTGKNRRAVEYIRRRLKEIEYVSDTPWRLLLRDTGYNLVSRHNYFWVKVRSKKSSSGNGTERVPPVAAYFGMGPEHVEIKKSKSGKIEKYRQRMPDGRYEDYMPRDIIHFYVHKKSGFDFATPSITPVKEDIKVLRRIEENIELLIYQNLFPIFHYKVGTEQKPAGTIRLPDGAMVDEVEFVRTQIAEMPTDGGMVTPERHEIKMIGSDKEALNVSDYLAHFKQRVLSGLGISGVDIGEGTANRACYSSDTETLTDSGFKFYWEITPTDKIATFNPKNNALEYHLPKDSIYLYEYSGPMLHFKNTFTDILVTPDHDMWKADIETETYQKIKAQEIEDEEFIFRTGGLSWEGKSSVASPFAEDDRVTALLGFITIYILSGRIACFDNSSFIIFSLDELSPEVSAKLILCGQALNLASKKMTFENNVDLLVFYSSSLISYIKKNVGYGFFDKRIPYEFLQLKTEHLSSLFKDLTDTTEIFQDRRQLSIGSKALADQLQIISIKLGFTSFLEERDGVFLLTLRTREDFSLVKEQIYREDYSGEVYCFNVPNHLFITRRNGKIAIQGNTADTMSKTMIDSAKDYQSVMEEVINYSVFQELLLESDFDFDVLAPENIVTLKFKEIDIEEQMKKNTNSQVLYNGNIITIDESRDVGGYENITPKQEAGMYSARVTIPEIEHQAVASAATAPEKSTTGKVTNPKPAAVKQALAQNRPSNQHGKKTGPQKTRLDKTSFLLGLKILDKKSLDATSVKAFKDMVGSGLKEIALSSYHDAVEDSELYDLLEESELSAFLDKKVSSIVGYFISNKKNVSLLRSKLRKTADFVSQTLFRYGEAIRLRNEGFLTATFNDKTIDLLSVDINDCILQESGGGE